jgi:hypothetical protein
MIIEPRVTAAIPGQTYHFMTDFPHDIGEYTWSATSGSGTPGGPPTYYYFDWTAPSSGTARITAVRDDGVNVYTAVLDLTITMHQFNYRPSLVVEGTLDDTTLLHTMENGGRRGRRKTPALQRWELKFNNRSMAEYEAALALFDSAGKLEPFTMLDPVLNSSRAWYFDSAISQRFGGRGCDISYSFRVVEA